ncbi:Z1 domain-containing protein [Embleya hyalina]|uniref:DEAD/DEAH box helicase n=1 Tax=Embleya hyalina TaxID=516124 RepID=A0A401YYM9_9ACTN|nr:Z1 domain-containing protein [Embleya hyalina]GCD99650.1 DEAD/DEAH box helicase [Embleya hyalina]
MTSGGEGVERHMQVLRALMERDGLTVDQALVKVPGLIPDEDHDAVREAWKAQSSVVIQVLEPTELSAAGPRSWFETHDTSQGYYWTRQRSFLKFELKRKDAEVDNIDLSSDRVLAHLEDPQHREPFDVRGLVVGHVQSGKTSNFSALIAKAADAGYKIVIVLSGLHNSLRQQTQRRLQRDLGHEDSPTGVGQGVAEKWWTWMTGEGLDGDFVPHTNTACLQGQSQVILVVKKNKSRLDRLIDWIDRVPEHVPVLVIDDEADQASVNTGGNRGDRGPALEELDLTSADFDAEGPASDELDPSAINLRVRRLLGLFARCSYVAYTATPFANVLINPDANDHEAGEDLFPRDFILTLPHPPGTDYVGTERLFGRDELMGDAEGTDGLDVIRIVPDADVSQVVPTGGNAAVRVPASLRAALCDYLLASAGRLARAETDRPCTMLVHVDVKKDAQDRLAEVIGAELSSMRQSWRYDRTEFEPQLRERWDRDFRPLTASMNIDADVSFETIEPYLDPLLGRGVEVRVLNSNHGNEIDFDVEPTLKAVLVGGNKLSRGVTIEGLLVSYYVRRTPYYDTLLQMGRWFGYRGDHVDLTRLYSTQQLVGWFHDLATIEEELRRQIEDYVRRGLTPLRAAPRIRSHARMQPTARNKMRDAALVEQAFDGRKLQTLRFPFGIGSPTTAFEENLALTRRLLSGLGAPVHVHAGHFGWNRVDAQPVLEFVEAFSSISQGSFERESIVDYIRDRVRVNELTLWHILVSGLHDPGATVDLGIVDHPKIGMITRSRKSTDPQSLGVVTEPGDESFGLTDTQKTEAERFYQSDPRVRLADAYRCSRTPQEGLLVLYPIDPNSQPGSNAKLRRALFEPNAPRPDCVMAYSISFPHTRTIGDAQYLSGPRSERA